MKKRKAQRYRYLAGGFVSEKVWRQAKGLPRGKKEPRLILLRLSPAALRAVACALDRYVPNEHYAGWMEAERETRARLEEIENAKTR